MPHEGTKDTKIRNDFFVLFVPFVLCLSFRLAGRGESRFSAAEGEGVSCDRATLKR